MSPTSRGRSSRCTPAAPRCSRSGPSRPCIRRWAWASPSSPTTATCTSASAPTPPSSPTSRPSPPRFAPLPRSAQPWRHPRPAEQPPVGLRMTRERTQLGRHPERGRADRDLVGAILDEALVCHVGFVAGGYPTVIPTLHARLGDTVYLHGSPASRMLQAAPGAEVCVTVT